MTWQRLSPWLFPSLGQGPDDVIVTMEGDPPPREDFERLHPSLAYYLVNDWVSLAESRAQLEELWIEFTGEPSALTDARVREIVAAFEEERLVLWGPIRAGVTEPAEFPATPQGPTGERTEIRDTWIELELYTDQGTPVGHEEYSIVTPEGDRRSGRLDERGHARIAQLVAGTCDIGFPRIDGREWGRALPPPAPQEADATSHVHEARVDEDLTTIAALYRFRHWKTVWHHPDNAALRSSRSPELLYPADQVAIPERTERKEEGSTGRRHRFLVRTASRWIRIILLDYDRSPLRNAAYALFSNGAIIAEDTTDSSGAFERPIPSSATVLTLDCEIGAFQLRVGALNPLDGVEDQGVSGAQARLNNLGYHAGPIDGLLGPETEAALRRFQQDQGTHAHGKLDESTKALLKSAHGC